MCKSLPGGAEVPGLPTLPVIRGRRVCLCSGSTQVGPLLPVESEDGVMIEMTLNLGVEG